MEGDQKFADAEGQEPKPTFSNTPTVSDGTHVDELAELLHKSLRLRLRACDDGSEERTLVVESNREAVDVVPASCKHARDAADHAAFVGDEYADGSFGHALLEQGRCLVDVESLLSRSLLLLLLLNVGGTRILRRLNGGGGCVAAPVWSSESTEVTTHQLPGRGRRRGTGTTNTRNTKGIWTRIMTSFHARH